MSTNKPSNDQPDKASDFDDELGVPSYCPSKDSKSAEAVKNSGASAATPQSTKPSDALLSDAPTSNQKSSNGQSAGQESTLSFSRPSGAKDSSKAQAAPAKNESEPGAKIVEASEPKRSSVFDQPGRAQPQEITPTTNKAPQSPVESQPTETMNLGPTTGSQNNSYNDGDFASRNYAGSEEPTTVTPAAGGGYSGAPNNGNLYGNEPTTVNPAVGAGAGAGAGAAYATSTGNAQQFDTPSSYSDDTAMALDADSAAAAQAEEEKALRKQYGKRGTIDFGLLFIRIALGAYLIIEGVRTLFTIGDAAGIAGLESEFGNYAMASILALGVPVAELGAGVFLVLGLLTPFAAMVGMVVTGFMAIHELAVSGSGLDVFGWPETLWLSLILFVINVGIQFTGPGFISVDSALGVKALSSPARRPLASSWIFFILGAAALVAVWWFGAGVNPLN